VRTQVARIVGEGEDAPSGQLPFTPRAKKVLELSLREGLSLGHNYVGTEHILLGLVRENDGVAARILLDFGVDAEKIRNEIIRMLSGPGRRGRAAPLESSGMLTARRRGAWEYRVEEWPPAEPQSRQAQLNDLGSNGWQLVAVVPAGERSQFIFQRPETPGRLPRPGTGRREHRQQFATAPDDAPPAGDELTVPSGLALRDLATALCVPAMRLVELLIENGTPRIATDRLSDEEILLIAERLGRKVTITHDGPPSD
jgi:hypothetical protein